MLYILIALYIIFFVYIHDIKQVTSLRNVSQFSIFVVFVLLAGFRYRLAPDTVAYMTDFANYTKKLDELTISSFTSSRYQPFWIILNSFCKTVGNFVTLQITAAIILNASIFYFFRQTSTKVFSCILFYYLITYFYFNMEVVRESLALSMFLLAIIRYNKGQMFYCYLFIFAAILFHHFAIVMLIVPMYLSNLISDKFKIWSASIIVGVLLFLPNPLLLIASFMGSSSSFDLSFYDLVADLTIVGYFYAFLRVLPVIIVFLLHKNGKIPNVLLTRNTAFGISIIYIIIIAIRATTIPFMDRFANYFIIIVIVIVTGALFDLFKKYLPNPLQFSALAISALVSALFYVLPMMKKDPLFDVPVYKRYYPYYSIFSNKTDPDREHVTALEAKE